MKVSTPIVASHRRPSARHEAAYHKRDGRMTMAGGHTITMDFATKLFIAPECTVTAGRTGSGPIGIVTIDHLAPPNAANGLTADLAFGVSFPKSTSPNRSISRSIA